MDFSLPTETQVLAERVRKFVCDQIIPYERDSRLTPHGPTEELRLELNSLARRAGLFAPHVPDKYGGLGLNHVARAAVFEAAGYSTLGPIALHCAAPDEGNMHLLNVVASESQKERWLKDLAQGMTRSCFCMTEPNGGAGSDPSLMRTTATRDGSDYLINGVKWLITGAEGAAFAIIIARHIEDGYPANAVTMFLTDMNRDGISIERKLDTLDGSFTGGHSVVSFADVRIPETDILGEAGKGFHYAQVRLAPARLTHCMRWLGSAVRAHDIACEYASTRTAFGKPIGEHEGVGFQLADNGIDIHMARLAVQHCAWLLDCGEKASAESSMAKVFCSEAIWRVADRCVQILGGLGLTGDTVVERIFREVRGFRIYDGPSEVHRWSLARRELSKARAFPGAIR